MTKTEAKEEARLIRAAKKDRRFFAPLYEKYFYPVFMFCYNRVGDQSLANDLCSQTFLKAMLHLKKYEHRGAPFGAWLIKIATNEVNQHFRNQKKSQDVELNDAHMKRLADDAEVADTEANRIKLLDCLNGLNTEESQLIEFRFFESYSFAEIAEVYSISEASAKMRVYRILNRMKETIQKMGRS